MKKITLCLLISHQIAFSRSIISHGIQVVDEPFKDVEKAFVIVGNDRRGTAYGVFELSKQIGVSPWYWWADVPVKKSARLFIRDGNYTFKSPSVKYRGIFINDEDMLGELTMHEKVQLMEDAIEDPRAILKRHIDKNIEEIPRVFIPYKEVLEIYENGVNLPEDITIVWPDDNYGYIKRSSNYQEQKRSGRSGAYYHISYLGVPHEYLWLNTTPPALIYEELKKAYETGADRVWVVNVGDIKPGEYGMEFFLDLAWNIGLVSDENTNNHLSGWFEDIFGPEYSSEITEIMQTYYQPGFIRKPEYMSWGYIYNYNWHLTMPNSDTEFFFTAYQEAEKRIQTYEDISEKAKKIYTSLEPELQPTFFQLVYYPVVASGLLNKIILYGQQNRWYALQGRVKANELAKISEQCYNRLQKITKEYNEQLNGKWNGMMSLKQAWENNYQKLPKLERVELIEGVAPAIFVEASDKKTGISNYTMLPCFDAYYPQSHYIDINNRGDKDFTWTATVDKDWIKLGASEEWKGKWAENVLRNYSVNRTITI